MQIFFYPESNNEQLTKATEEYREIWAKDGKKIIDVLSALANLSFKEDVINALIHEGISQSHPLLLRASYTHDEKKATLVHELGHRVLSSKNKVKKIKTVESSIESHKMLNLILYDAWINIYGKELADKIVLVESKRRPEVYEVAWKWALLLSREEREEKFKQLILE